MKSFFGCFFLSTLLIGCAVSKAGQLQQKPQVFVLDAEALKSNKAKVAQNNATLLPAYKQLLKDGDKALKEGPFSVVEKKNAPPSGDKHDFMSLAPYHWPDSTKSDGLPYIRKDGQTNPEVKEYLDKEYLPKMCELVHTLSLAYYFSGDEKYAAHAAQLLKVWFLNPETKMNPNLNYAQAIKGVNEGRGAGIIDARHFVKVIDGIGLLQDSKYWKKEDQKGMQQWFSQFLTWLQTSENGKHESNAANNHGTFYDALRLSSALFIDSTDLAKNIVATTVKRLDQQMDAEGKFPKEMERTIALHYSTFNLNAFFMVARMAERTGFDLWNYTSPKGNSLQKGFAFVKPYLLKQAEWTGMQIKPFDFEDGLPILLTAATKFKCAACRDGIKIIAGEKAERSRYLLLY